MKLKDIKAEFAKYIVLKDEWALDMVMASLVGNFLIPRDPIWLMMIGPSSGGKTTLIAPLDGGPGIHMIDDLTEKTLISGFKSKGKEMSLLRHIGASGIMVFSDFTTILSKNPMSKGEILTQLKMVYDGKFTKHTGTGGTSWEGKIGFVGASTPDIYAHLEAGRSMGERFIYYWLDQPTDEEVAMKQQEVNMSSKEITKIMKPMFAEYMLSMRRYFADSGVPALSMTKEQHDSVRSAAIFCVNGKTVVHTDFKTGKIDQIPVKAGVGRDNKAFEALLHTFQYMDAYEYDEPARAVSHDRIRLVEKCAWSSINCERRKVMEVLVANERKMGATEIGTTRGIGLEKDGVEKYLIPLHAVGLVKKTAGNPHLWSVEDEKTKAFIKSVSRDKIEKVDATDLFEVDDGVGQGNYY